MKITDELLLAFQEAVQRDDRAKTRQILETVREQNPSASQKLSDLELQRRLLLRASRLLTGT